MLIANPFQSLPSVRRPSKGTLGCALTVLIASLAASGCGDGRVPTYPVKGKVTYPDGAPVTAGVITFEPIEPPEGVEPFPARGVVQEDGTYILTTFNEADGAMPGRHRATIMEPYSDVDRSERKPTRGVADKYWDFDTSGLQFEVKDEPNEFNITVEPARR